MPSWVSDAATSGFPLRHLPLGVRRRPDGSHALVARIGDHVADLRVLAEIGLFDDCGAERADFRAPALNTLIGRGNEVGERVRERLRRVLDAEPTYFNLRERQEIFLLPLAQARLTLPVAVGDAAVVAGDAVEHLRASSFVPDGAAVRCLAVGPKSAAVTAAPHLAFVTGAGSRLGHPPTAEAARDHVFGMALVLSFRESGPGDAHGPAYARGPARHYVSVLGPWITPAVAVSQLSLALDVTPFRRRRREVAAVDLSAEQRDGSAAVAKLTAGGARLRPGDLLLRPLPALDYADLAGGDVAELRCTSAVTLASAGATVLTP